MLIYYNNSNKKLKAMKKTLSRLLIFLHVKIRKNQAFVIIKIIIITSKIFQNSDQQKKKIVKK